MKNDCSPLPDTHFQYARQLRGFDDKVVSMYARGMTTHESQDHRTVVTE